MSSDNAGSGSMGDLFSQRRAAAKQHKNQTPSSNEVGGGGGGGGGGMKRVPSFLEIQEEQEREAKKAQQQSSGGNRGGSSRFGDNDRSGGQSYSRSGGYDDSGGGGGRYGGRRDGGYGGGGGGYDRYGGSGRDNYSNNSRRGNSNNRSNYPIEQGKIVTLLDKFGFIHCAQRPLEIFFHYSELMGVDGHSEDLNIGDEVEFRVGPASSPRGGRGGGGGYGNENSEVEKMAAYEVKVLEAGTVEWEVEEEPKGVRRRGKVERLPPRSDVRGGGRNAEPMNGIIRLLLDDDEDDNNDDNKEETKEVYFTSNDYQTSPRSNNPSRLGRNDVIEFTLMKELRTNRTYARNITMLQSERERLREEREARLLENATLERGMIDNLKEDFGFLKSNKRRELIFFHYSHVVTEEKEEESGGGGKGRKWSELNLKEGQEVEFLVVKEEESGRGKGGGSKLSARKVIFLPPGSVKFSKVIQHGVCGTILEPPHPAVEPLGSITNSGGNRGGKNGGGGGATPAVVGKVRLHQPITFKPGGDDEAKEEQQITEVLFHANDSPGGSFVITRDGSQMGVWVREGDTILFDVVQDVVDDTFCVSPTLCRHPLGDGDEEEKEGGGEESSLKNKPRVRLIELALAGRAEGIVSSIQNNYGFIHCAERNVDAYFRLYELFPSEMQKDLVEDMNVPIPKDSSAAKNLIGMEVSFDLSLQGIVTSGGPAPSHTGRGRGRSHSNAHERENLKAQRILLLPKSSIVITKVLASSIRCTVTKEDPKQAFAGYIDLETPLKAMTLEERHPIVAKLLDLVQNGRDDEIIFHDVQSEKEHQVVTSMVDAKDDLDWSFVPATGRTDIDSSHPGRLRIYRVKPTDDDSGSVVADSANGKTTSSSSDVVTDVSSDVGSSGAGGSNKEGEETSPPTAATPKKKKKPKKMKAIKTIRYDKHSLFVGNKGSMSPPAKGDVITCDIFQSRRTGAITVENLRVVERKQIERGLHVPGAENESSEANMSDVKASGTSGVGLVIEVIPRSHYGFISVYDETATKQEKLFFHMSNVVYSTSSKDAEEHGGNGGEKTILSSKHGNSTTIRRGDEVKFEFGTGKNGKKIALNIHILPHGTLKIPAKTDKNACQGYVLMEPSHTSLTNTPSHVVHSTPTKGGGGGRWDNVKEDRAKPAGSGSNVMEEGCILLLSDPSNLFAQKLVERKRTESMSSEPPIAEQSASLGDDVEINPDSDGSSDSKENTADNATTESEPNSSQKNNDKHATASPVKIFSAVGTHLSYKNGAVALRGGGSSTDSSSGGPKRGDLVSFIKGKGGKTVKDLRVVKRGAAKTVRGELQKINVKEGTAEFISSNDTKNVYQIGLSEVVSCHLSTLKEKLAVEGILHEGQIYGVCRSVDLYLESKICMSSGKKERPRLNLTVKKELQGLGGKIIAQSGMAKGPDGTNGFAKGWTKRLSPYAATFTYHPAETQQEEQTETEDVHP